MKNLLLLVGTVAFMMTNISCSQNQSESEATGQKEEKTEAKAKKAEMTVELYCKVTNAEKALLMEKYWDKFKNKSYEEVKDVYEQYEKDENAIHEKYGIEESIKLMHFFRSNWKEIEEFQKDNPENKDYP
ncbi:MAG: hypothetical protein ACOCYF_02630, partial [Bacteroidota bacterium]